MLEMRLCLDPLFAVSPLMPDHILSSLPDRRQFLTVAGVSLAPVAVAAPDSAPDFTFAVVTDTHLGRTSAEAKRFPQIIERINSTMAAFTLFAGDLVDNGQNAERAKLYPVWVDAAKGLKKDWFAVPGNHDPDDAFSKYVQPKTDWSFTHKGIRFVGFRNAQPNPGHDGIITPDQLKWLDSECVASSMANEKTILLAHVIYHKNAHPDVGWYVKEGREAFGKLLEANKSVVAFLAGHFHCGLRGWNDSFGVQEVILPSAAYNRDRRLSKAPGYGLSVFDPGFVLCELFRDRLRLDYRGVDGKSLAHRDLAFRS